jgi:hypothetical protein
MPLPGAAAPAVRRLHADLRLVPAEARLVLGLDIERLRASSAGRDLVAGPLRSLALLWGDFAGLASLEQARQVLVAVPGERQPDDRWLAILRSEALSPARTAPWLKDHPRPESAATFVPPDGIVLAHGAWARPASDARSLADDPELFRLCERAASGHALWMAAAVPPDLRRRLLAQDRFPDVGSLLRLRASVALDRVLSAEVVAELSNAPDARSLAERLGDYLRAAKRHPDLLAQGLVPYLESVKLTPKGPNLHATLELPAEQAGELVARLGDMLRAM